jgi:predicted transcriptional regulator
MTPRLSRLELQIMELLWTHGASSIRAVHDRIATRKRPAYTTVQTMINRLEAKKAVRRIKKIGNAHIFEAAVSRHAAQRRLIDEFLGLLGGTQPVMAQLIEAGKLNMDDIREAERILREFDRARKP